MTNNIQILKRETKTRKFMDSYNRADYGAAASGYFSSFIGMGGIYPYGQCRFWRNNSFRSACIKSHLEQNRLTSARNFNITDYQLFFCSKFKLGHQRLECGNKTLWHGIFGVGDKNRAFSLEGKKLPVDFVPAGAVRNNFSGERSRCSIINFIYCNKEPLVAKSFFNLFNSFYFHNLSPLYYINYHTLKRKSRVIQGGGHDGRHYAE